MNRTRKLVATLIFGALAWCAAPDTGTNAAQDPPPQNPPSQAAPAGQRQGGGQRRTGVFGKITAIHGDSIELASPRGGTVTVKITSETQIHKDTETSKLSDFAVGDLVVVRGDENPDHTWTAQMIRSAPNGALFEGNRGGGMGGGPDAGRRQMGVLGQDYVFGEIKAIDAPKLTILRPDNVTQTVELTEETSLRKGRDSVTMADIQVGDHVFVRGGMKGNAFEPRSVMVIGPEQWKRMQEMGMPGTPPANPPKENNPQQKPPELPH